MRWPWTAVKGPGGAKQPPHAAAGRGIAGTARISTTRSGFTIRAIVGPPGAARGSPRLQPVTA